MNQDRPRIDLTNAQDVTCDSCGNYTFQEVVLMKRISALISPTGKEGIAPIPVFACNACGNINKQFLPTKVVDSSEEMPPAPEQARPSLILEK